MYTETLHVKPKSASYDMYSATLEQMVMGVSIWPSQESSQSYQRFTPRYFRSTKRTELLHSTKPTSSKIGKSEFACEHAVVHMESFDP